MAVKVSPFNNSLNKIRHLKKIQIKINLPNFKKPRKFSMKRIPLKKKQINILNTNNLLKNKLLISQPNKLFPLIKRKRIGVSKDIPT